MELPKQRNIPQTKNPDLLILFGFPKSGKTTAVAGLDNCLHVVLGDESAEHTNAMFIQINNSTELSELAKEIASQDKPYKYICIDSTTELEDMVLPIAKAMYKKTPMGKSFVGDDVTTLPNGAGYRYTREAFKAVVKQFQSLCECLILIGHTKDKTIMKSGKEMSENALDLTGKLERIMGAKADALGFVYRKGNQCLINFNGGGDTVIESRSAHLAGKEIVISEKNEDGSMTTYWDNIFIPQEELATL